MKKAAVLLLFGALITMNFKPTDNPFYREWQTPYGMPDFEKITSEHYMPAFKDGMQEQLKNIDKIVNNSEKPTFENTILAWEESDELFSRVAHVFFNLSSANTSESLQAIQKEVSPLIAAHEDNINLNVKLFERVNSIYNGPDKDNLTSEQQKLLEKYYKNMVLGGANLNPQQKEKLKKINEEITVLQVQFSENVLKEDNAFEMILDEKDLTGLPDNIKSGAAQAAKEKGYEGKWLFTTHKPSLLPFTQFSERRDLREKIFKAYINRGDNNNENDNKAIINNIVNLRIRKAKLLGYDTPAHYSLEETMAKTPEKVYNLLDQVWPAAIRVANNEAAMMQKMIDEEGQNFKLEAWDWSFYAEKIRASAYDLNENQVSRYLQLENVRKGSFILAEKLFGLTFEERNDLPKYNQEVKTYIVKDSDGEMIGVYLSDWFYRSNKRGGAWMNEFRPQSNIAGNRILPIITNVGNFTKPSGDTPSLLTLDEVETLFHEFGHALHGLLSDVTYPSLSGTNVPRDFVEFPSQVLENWVLHPEMLKLYAYDYETGEIMPEELIKKVKNSWKFNQGFKTVELVAAAYLDMAWHSQTVEEERDVNDFENNVFVKIGLIPQIVSRYRTTNFRHIVGGYDSGYYSYLWSEVLDADTFEAFKEKGIFDQETAQNYKNKILARGGTMDALEMYMDFRGHEPEITPYLERKGLN